MKILFLADEESKMYWEYFKKEDFKGIDIIVSCGDLNPSYLSFLTTMVGVPLLYVHGNHDDKYNVKPPEGCICIEDEIYEYEGVRFLGLGGSNRYKPPYGNIKRSISAPFPFCHLNHNTCKIKSQYTLSTPLVHL